VWAAEVHLQVLGTRFTVRCTSAAHAELVERVMTTFVALPSGVPSRRRHGLIEAASRGVDVATDHVIPYRDCSKLGRPGPVGAALARLVTSINRIAINGYDGFATHAAVVARGDLAIALPADSGGGKSTLTAACLLAGLEYVSDEALCVDPADGAVVPYPKPIALSERSVGLLGLRPESLTVPVTGVEGLATPNDLGAMQTAGPLRLAHVVMTRIAEGGVHMHEIAASEAMAALLSYSFNHYKLGEDAFHLAASLASAARAWQLTYSDPGDAAEAIAALL
jgi:hypothetical protein